MKKFLSFLTSMLTLAFCNAQITDGMHAADFNLYEIDTAAHAVDTTHTINLYSMLNDYKTVFIDISASTCAPCSLIHHSGSFQSIVNNYGPGTTANDSRVLVIEGARTGTSWESITGQLGSRYWDMTEGINYPLIPLRMEPNYTEMSTLFRSNYPYQYYPTLFVVCPNRIIYNLNRYNDDLNMAEEWHDYALSKCPCVTHNNAAYLLPNSLSLEPAYFCEYEINPIITIQNLGTDTLTSATILLTYDNNVDTLVWTGNLPQFDHAEVEFPTISGSSDSDFSMTFTITMANGVANEDTIHNSDSYTVHMLSEGHISTIEADFSDYISGTEPPAGWVTLEKTGEGYFCSYDGLDFFYFWSCRLDSGLTYELAMPVFDFSNTENPMLQFDVAYCQSNDSTNDKLEALYSLDCGETWISAYNKAGAALSLRENFYEGCWLPDSAGDFRTDSVLLSQAAHQADVIIKFVFTSDHGNNISFDNVKVYDANPVSIKEVKNSELTIYPNPTANLLFIDYNKVIEHIDIYDLNGKLVGKYNNVQHSIDVSHLSSGTYILNFITEEGQIAKKFVKE